MAGEGSMFKFLKPRLRPHPIDIQAAAAWGVAATTTALWLIQLRTDSRQSDHVKVERLNLNFQHN
ncbi:Ubiquinol-cytochrome c reductase complex 6.7 kDa [Gossypium arboreum]|uniref:Ubiquinol-cytochrome c reductase complex 6.7 kDa n=1 Tax=Gossypium arboreum TaxID=29729 RepID=A0A0B0P6W1_GOSAR|nr:Ubiquinol-cytochrome c reductase complex 6.7 kDa [Gossypium arboreum]